MKTADLEAEYRASIANLKNEDAKELVDQVLIPFFLVMIYQMIGILPVRLDRTGYRWEPDSESGQLAYITPLRIDRSDTALSVEAWGTPRCGELVDLIAWDPRLPNRWALRTALSTWLGAVPFDEPFPALIRASPLSWLKANCDGIVLLTRDPVLLRSILGDFEHGIECESPHLTARLNKLVRQPLANTPRVVSPPYIKRLSDPSQARMRALAREDRQTVDEIVQPIESTRDYTPLRMDDDYAGHINDLHDISRAHARLREDIQPVENTGVNGAHVLEEGRRGSRGGSIRRRGAELFWGSREKRD